MAEISEIHERLEILSTKGKLFDFVAPSHFYNIEDIDVIFDTEVLEWINDNIATVFFNYDYQDFGIVNELCYDSFDDNKGYWHETIVMMYFQSEEDLMAFILRWT